MAFPGERLLVVTGDGKGKTTAALGLVLRALGHDQPVAVIHFLKCDGRTGEHRMLTRLGVSVHLGGLGFVPKPGHPEYGRHGQAACATLAQAARLLAAGDHRLVVLDEVCNAVHLGLIAESALLTALAGTAAGVRVVCTGRAASAGLLALADTVSEVRCLAHGYQRGLPALEGIER